MYEQYIMYGKKEYNNCCIKNNMSALLQQVRVRLQSGFTQGLLPGPQGAGN